MANILNVISAVTPMGGTITKLRELMTRSKEHKHFLFHPGFKANRSIIESEIDWYKVNNIPAYYSVCGRNILSNAYQVTKIIKKHNIDIVHFYFNHEQSFAWLVGIMNPKVKMIRSIVGFDKKLSFLRRSLLKLSLPAIDNYIFISNYIKTLYEQDYPVLKSKNTTIIANGPVNVVTDITPMSTRKSLVVIGGLTERKNSEVLIEAMNIIANTYGRKDIVLNIIGDGERRAVCENLISSYGLNKQIKLVGYTRKVASYLNDCAIYVHPATTEGFGIAVVEAMQMGCPCIVANKGALPELVKNKENGYVVNAFNPKEWADTIIKLWDNPGLREEMGRKSIERVESKFSLHSFVSNHDKLYTALLCGKSI